MPYTLRSPNPEPQKSPEKEGWGSYIERNLGQFPATALSTFQSGFGGGDILRLLNEKLGNPQVQGQLPTYAEARGQFDPLVGKERPEDANAQLLLKELGLAGVTGGLSSIGNLGRYALGSAASHLGGAAGRFVGGAVGEQLGDKDIGELVGGVGGGLLGGTAAQAGIKALPSRYFKDAPVKAYKENIKNLDLSRKPLYEKAKQLDRGVYGNAGSVQNTLKDISEDITKGLNPADKRLIKQNITSLQQDINKFGGKLSLRDAKKYQKNFNDQIFNRNSSLSYRRHMMQATQSLNEFIENTGSPEHNASWRGGEEATIQLKRLQKGEKDFIRAQKSNTILEKVWDRMSNWGLGGVGAVLGGIIGGKPGGAIGGILGRASTIAAKETRAALNAFRDQPKLFREYKQMLANTTKQNIPKTIARINELGKKIEDSQKKEQEPVAKKMYTLRMP